MKKYLVKLVFNIDLDNGRDNSEFDEQLRVIVANSAVDAFYKGRTIGKREEETLVTGKSEMMAWNFIDVSEVYPVEEIEDGGQVFSSTHKTNESKTFINYIRQKSMEMQVKNLTFV